MPRPAAPAPTLEEILASHPEALCRSLEFRRRELKDKHHCRPADNAEAWSLEQMVHDAARADAYWALACGLELSLRRRNGDPEDSPDVTALRRAKAEANLLMERYDALFFEELRFLAVRRARRADFLAENRSRCATMQVST